MYAFFMILFIFLCFFLALFILIQQGKGDLGLSNLSGGQMLFGGSGGQEFFEKATWFMGAIFVFGALGLSILKSKEDRASVLDSAIAQPQALPQRPAPKPVQAQPEAEQTASPVTQQADTVATHEQANKNL